MSDSGQCQRSVRAGVALATFALLTAACSTSSSPDAVDQPAATSSTVEPEASAESNTESTDETSDSEPQSTIPDADDELDPAILDDLPGLIVWRSTDGDIITSTPGGVDEMTWSLGDSFFNMQPTWARSGRSLAWSRSNQGASQVARVDLGRTDPVVEAVDTAPPPFYLSWSPDQERILGLRNGRGGLEAVVVDNQTSSAISASLGQPFFSDWSSDDSLVAAVGGASLVEVGAQDLTPQERPLPAPLGFFGTPVALPDNAVLIATQGSTTTDVSRLDPDGELTVLASTRGLVLMSLSPDASQVAVLVIGGEEDAEFISFAVAQGEDTPELPPGVVSIIDLESGEVESRSETGVIAVNWSPTGEHIGLLQLRNNELQWLFGDPTNTAETITSVSFQPTAALAQSYLPFIDQYDRSSTWWSPDGNAFVFSGTVLGREGVWIDRVDDQAGPALFAEGDIAFWSPE